MNIEGDRKKNREYRLKETEVPGKGEARDKAAAARSIPGISA